MGVCPSIPDQSIHEFTVKDSYGRDLALSRYRGKVLLIVNVASRCTFADMNYAQLSDLYARYKDRGLEILAFPCNQFLKQKPASSQETKALVCKRFKVEYPIFQKVRVNGANAAPIYKFLKAHKSGLFGSAIKWNFTKFLVDKNGFVLDRYAPTTPPLDIEDDIKKALEKVQDANIIMWI